MKPLAKFILQSAALILALPLALLSGLGRVKAAYVFFAQLCALFPGLPGDYLRIGYYRWTLASCSPSSRIEFGSYFAHPEARLAEGVYIGSHTIIGRAHLGARSQIASGVQILSGRHQHRRGLDGQITGADHANFSVVSIGADCWLGAGCLVMADIGEGTTVGAGAVVVQPLAPHVVAAGNPARPLAR